ncbi:hypothetical protein [Streptomyces sp. AC555_RSS877]|uniref:hypothetical protein n=1 Tax=Streptomyces sp. AC555_RSS877 TaxID=2823688 RepID=UPI0020B73815|nr:hypothetical protein [Streptomyces sp. AC555_RSS877]
MTSPHGTIRCAFPTRCRTSITRRIHRKAAALLIAGSLAGLTACSSSDKKDETSDESPAVTQSPTESATPDPKETAKKEALAAYGAYWQEMEKLYADRTGKSARLDQYAASAALKNAESDAKRAHENGLIYLGDVAVTDQTVTKIDASGKIPNATVSSCLDISRWQTVDARTQKPAPLPDNRLTKYMIVSTVEKYPEGWRVTSDEPQGKSC